MRGPAKRACAIVVSAASVAALASAPSCTLGTSYDVTTFEGGFTSIGDGGLSYVVDTVGGPFRSADQNFAVYIAPGTFDTTPAVVTIAPRKPPPGGYPPAYEVTSTIPPKVPFIVIFANPLGQPENAILSSTGTPIRLIGTANGLFGVAPSPDTFAAAETTNSQTNAPKITLPTCLSQCGLAQLGGQISTAFCSVNFTGASGAGQVNDEALYNCILACPALETLITQCISAEESAGASVVCATGAENPSPPPCPGEPCCVGGTTVTGCQTTCPPGNLAFQCDGDEDCTGGTHCCAVATGTSCGTCGSVDEVCNSKGSCIGGAPCSQAFACSSITTGFGALELCGSPPSCPIGAPPPTRAVACPGQPPCGGTNLCCIPNSDTGVCLSNASECGTGYILECDGPSDCAQSPNGGTCCAYERGTRCQDGCEAQAQVCNNGGTSVCNACTPLTGCNSVLPFTLDTCLNFGSCPVTRQ